MGLNLTPRNGIPTTVGLPASCTTLGAAASLRTRKSILGASRRPQPRDHAHIDRVALGDRGQRLVSVTPFDGFLALVLPLLPHCSESPLMRPGVRDCRQRSG